MTAASRSQSKRILVAEEIEASRFLMRAIIEANGHQADTVSNGEDALKALTIQDYDLVLMSVDISPSEDSQACAAIRRLSAANSTVPIVVLAGGKSAEQMALSRSANVEGCIAKPVHPETLLKAIDRWARPKTEAGAAKAGATLVWDKKVYDDLALRLGSTSMREMLKALGRRLGDRIGELRTRAGDAEFVKREAHDLTSISGTLGFIGLSEVSRAAMTCEAPEDVETLAADLADAAEKVMALIEDHMRY